MKPRLTLVGRLPPPLGGISIHVERLAGLASADYDVAVLDPFEPLRRTTAGRVGREAGTGSRLRGLASLLPPGPDLLHVHASTLNSKTSLLAAGLRGAGKRARRILTLHTSELVDRWDSAEEAWRDRLRSLIHRFNHVVAVSPEVASFVLALGVPVHRVSTIPAFLPGSPEPDPDITTSILAHSSSGRRPVLMAGNARPLFGFHELLDALEASPGLTERCVPVFCFYHYYEREYFRSVERRVRGLGGALLFRDLPPGRFLHLLSLVDVFVRPTSVDGDSVALREAASLGKQIVASSAVARPVGCLVYETGSPDALAAALEKALDDPSAGRVAVDPLDGGRRLLELYGRLADAAGPGPSPD